MTFRTAAAETSDAARPIRFALTSTHEVPAQSKQDMSYPQSVPPRPNRNPTGHQGEIQSGRNRGRAGPGTASTMRFRSSVMIAPQPVGAFPQRRPHPEELATGSAPTGRANARPMTGSARPDAKLSKRLEGWTQHDSRPSFETRAPDSASALPGERAPQDEFGGIYD